jgi:hypothetical protein
MTKSVRITRKMVLNAIEREPLTAGCFARSAPTCTFCAVGAVISTAITGLTESDIKFLGYKACHTGAASSDPLPKAIKKRAWLSAISIKWEQLAKKRMDAKGYDSIYDCTAEDLAGQKVHLKKWVTDNVPNGTIAVIKL